MPAVETIPAWAWMWGLAVAIFAGCKTLAYAAAPPSPAGRRRRAGFLFAWPGLDAVAFLGPRTATLPGRNELRSAALRTLAGLVLVFGVARLAFPASPWAAGWVGMVGLILALHFGSFALLSCAWRGAGVVARPLMDRPLASTSLGEFWGRRWNTAFRDLTHRFLFRPLTRRFGPRRAVWLGFLASGLVHDAVISLPAGGGHGGPTAYFLLQAAGLAAERSRFGRRLGLGRGATGRLFTLAVLGLPLGLLFHRPFVLVVIVPFLQAFGALPHAVAG